MIPARMSLAAVFALLATQAFAMSLKSNDVAENAYFPEREICSRYGGGDVSPALSWSGVPANAKSLAITMFDPDAHDGGWWHWLVVNIPTSTAIFARGAGSGALPAGAKQLKNSNSDAAYGGPCPPAGSGVHHYQITLWALGETPPENLRAADEGAWLAKHALASARLTPVYRK